MSRVMQELDDLFDELDQLLKNPDAGAALADNGVNISLAIVAADGLRAYLHGEKEKAAEELGTAAEEITARLAAARQLAAGKPS
jgi:CHASE3 domain sensor protein